MCKINTNIQLKEQFIQKCFVDYKTLPDFPSARREEIMSDLCSDFMIIGLNHKLNDSLKW